MTNELTCREAFDRLEEFLDRELSPEETLRVEGHLTLCMNCAREFRFEAGVLDGVRARLGRIMVPEHLVGRVSRALRQDGLARPPSPVPP